MPRTFDSAPTPPAGRVLDLTSVTGIDPVVTFGAAFPFLAPPTRPGVMGQFGDYPVVKFLGAGAAGYVFEAADPELDRPVVLKVLRPELAAADDHRQRFVREARAAAAVQSDHTVPIFAVGECEGLPFLVMPRLTGESLQTRLQRVGRLPVGEAVEVARQTALGLADAHDAGLIHRDIKPANLWVEPDLATGGVRRVRLLDFGLARPPAAVGTVTMLGGVIGTPHYMAPEQAQGEVVDHRGDLFALGVTLYVALTGRLPFTGPTLTATLVAVATKPHPPVSGVNPAVPPAVSELIDRLLAKRPADRPGGAAGVADELEAALQGMGVTFRPRGSASTVLPPPPPRTDRPAETPLPSVRTAELARLDTLVAPSTPAPPDRGRGLRWVGPIAAAVCLLTAVFVARWPSAAVPAAPPTIPVGVLHSQTGTMKLSEDPVVDATLFAIDEVNASGGVLGRKLQPVVADGESDPDVFAARAEQLLARDKVPVIFGCWTSASRKAVRPVVERNNGLLFYPVQYEGLERSPAVVYLGHAPNQQLLPAVDFLVTEKKAKRLYLVGSDYVFPRSANRIIRDHMEANYQGTAEVVGERYRPLGDDDWAKVVGDLLDTRPDAVLNTINGSSNYAFYRELRDREGRLGLPHLPVLSVSVTANELAALPDAAVAGDYLAGTYFDRPGAADEFRDRFRRKHGVERPTTDMMAAAYTGVHLWAAAANKAGSTDPAAVRAAVGGMSFDGPGGRVTVDADNYHLWQPVRIARVMADGELEVVSEANGGRAVKPEPFPPTRTPAQWDRFLRDLQVEYRGKWQAPPAR